MKRNKNNSINKVLFKRNRRRSIIGLFVLFFLTFLLFGMLWSFLFQPALGILTQQRFFAVEEFDKIDTDGINDGNGYIEFLDENYNVVHPKDSKNTYTYEEVDMMGTAMYVHKNAGQFKYIKDGKEYTQIYCGNDDASFGWYLKIDEELNYLDSANFNFIKDRYTEQDIDYILHEYNRDLRSYKYEFVSDYGNEFTLVMVVDKKIEFLELYEIVLLLAMAAFLILLYTLFIIYSTNATGKLIKRPLMDLSDAINDFSMGRHILIDKKYQVEEFNSIVESFNNMVYTLNELERKNVILTNQKQSMIANISHDLKTPITIIQGYIDVVRTGKAKGDAAEEYLNKIYSKSEYMTALINSFAEFSKLNHPDFQLNLKDENICEIVRNYLADTYNYIVDSGIETVFDIPDEIFNVKVDRFHFERSLANIISNFVKYNKKGTKIHVSVSQNKNDIVLVMENDGEPIDKDIVDNIFDPLVTGDISRSSESTGLGLASAKRVVELHGGRIKYENTKDYVNSFVITLPIT